MSEPTVMADPATKAPSSADSTLPLQAVSPRSRVAVAARLRKLQGAIGLIAIFIIAILISPHNSHGKITFLDPGNLTDIIAQESEIGLIALGMTFVVLTGGIDLSVGSVVAVASSIVALVLRDHLTTSGIGVHIVTAVAITVLASAALGVINGVVISAMRIQPFIMTLAAMLGLRGLAGWLTDDTAIAFGFGADSGAGGAFCDALASKGVLIGCFLGLAVILAIILRQTVFGRYTRAIGDNEKAAIYAGLPVVSVKIWVYTLSGLFAGLAGVLDTARSHQGNPKGGVGYELEAIAAVVIGGTSLSGGSGSIIGTIVGTLIMGVLTNILQLKHIDPNRELMIKAVIIVLAVWAQSRKRAQ